MTNLVNRDGSLKGREFRDLNKGGERYRIIQTVNNFEGGKFWNDSAFKASDTLKRLRDGAKKEYTREDLEARFVNVEIVDNTELEQ